MTHTAQDHSSSKYLLEFLSFPKNAKGKNFGDGKFAVNGKGKISSDGKFAVNGKVKFWRMVNWWHFKKGKVFFMVNKCYFRNGKFFKRNSSSFLFVHANWLRFFSLIFQVWAREMIFTFILLHSISDFKILKCCLCEEKKAKRNWIQLLHCFSASFANWLSFFCFFEKER